MSYKKRKKFSKSKSTITKMNVSFSGKKVLYLKESITFQSKYCILKNAL